MKTSIAAPTKLVALGKSVAMLDAILFPDDWDSRYHSFDAKWGRGEQVFSMRNGSGDFYFILFAKAGTVLHGFAHESVMSPWSAKRSKEATKAPYPGMFDGFPKALAYPKTAASFCADENEVTFCAWRPKAASAWRTGNIDFPKGPDPDGSADLLFILDGKPETYAKWAKSYVERAIPLATIKKVYAHAPLTKAIVSAVNPEADFAAVRAEAKTLGYP
jgi:hypothetical protein